LYIYNLISGLLLVDIAINLHKFSKCKVSISFEDFVDRTTTASGAGCCLHGILGSFVLDGHHVTG
jgi:hypothetical protein